MSIAPVTVTNEREIQPMQLSLEQLSGLKQQHEDELQELQRQMDSLSSARNRFILARNTLDEAASTAEGNPVLVPLNSSLYVPGFVKSPNKVLVELGTGYFCEKSVPAAKDLIDRKLQLVNKSVESIETVGANKRRALEQIAMVFNYKVALAQEARSKNTATK